MSHRLWLSLRRLLQVQSNGDCGSPRASGSTSPRKSSTRPGSGAASGLRPPPGRRTRSMSHASPARNSFKPATDRAARKSRDLRHHGNAAPSRSLRLSRRKRPQGALVQDRRQRLKNAAESPIRQSHQIVIRSRLLKESPPQPTKSLRIHLFSDEALVSRLLKKTPDKALVFVALA